MTSAARVLPALAGGAGAAIAARRFRRDMAAARARLASLSPHVALTARGPVEYAERGEGAPVLELHGIFGGYDQGVLIADAAVGGAFRVIAPSRFGYLGSPLPPEATPAAQADALASLLDTLGLHRVAVVAHSAGATSALQLALRHRDRVAALALVVPAAPGAMEVKPPPRRVARLVFGSDLAFWLIVRYRHARPGSMLGVPRGYRLTADDIDALLELMDTMLPARPRCDGALFDAFVSNPDVNRYPLEEIAVPTLVIGACDDPLALYRNVAAMAERIPGARLLTFEQGGHHLLGGRARARREITAHLNEALSGQS
jgi:pimeloyl-ACP methyl ester carboxylesterase